MPADAPESHPMPDFILRRDRTGADRVDLGLKLSSCARLNHSLIAASGAAGQGGMLAADQLARAELMLFAGKAIEADDQIHPLSIFFSKTLATAAPEPVSTFVVRRRIADLIFREPAAAPLRDDANCAALLASGVDIVRRTVAKYRGCMQIPPSLARRRRKTAQLVRAMQSGDNVMAGD